MQSKVMQFGLITTGWFALFLGALGAVLPLLPTTPFVLLAAGCFAKSSPRFYNWLLRNKYFSQMILDYQAYRGIRRRIKIRAISCMWLTMTLSAYLIYQPWASLTLLICAISVSLYLWRLPEPPIAATE